MEMEDKMTLTKERRREIARLESRLEREAVKEGARVIAERYGYNHVIRRVANLSGMRLA
jgi:hypothetical protein